MTPRCSRSGPRRRPGWTSSPTARSAGSPTRTTSPPPSRASTSTTRARRWTAAVTPTRCPASPARSAPAPDPAGGRGVPAGPHRPDHQDHRARAVHDVPAGTERLLPRPGVGGDGLRRRRQRRGQGPVRRGRRHRPDRRALHAGPARGCPCLRTRRAERRPRRRHGTTAVHICFGYAAIIHERPEGYSFLPELADCAADQISIETAQSGLDLGVLADLADKTVILGVIDLSDHAVESAETVADRVRRAFPYTSPDKIIIATDCGMKYLPRASAEGKLRAMSAAAATLRAEL